MTWGGLKGWPVTQRSGCFLAAGLNAVHGDAGCAGGEDRVGRSDVVHLGEDFGFQEEAFGHVFLDKVGLRDRVVHIGSEGQPVAACTGSQPNDGEQFPGLVDPLAQVGLRVGRGIGGDDVKPLRQILRRPTGADQAGTDDRYFLNLRSCQIFLHEVDASFSVHHSSVHHSPVLNLAMMAVMSSCCF